MSAALWLLIFQVAIPCYAGQSGQVSIESAHGGETLSNGIAKFVPQPSHTALLNSTALHVIIADNATFGPKHQPGYHGIAELRPGGDDGPNLLVPLFSGLNLEHIFSGDASSFEWHIFEPRRAPMQLFRLGTNRVELREERTEHWPLRSRLIYELNDHAVDFTYYGMPLADEWNKHHYVGVFFASYIQAPADLGIQFIGRSRPGHGDQRPRWIRHVPRQHGVAASHRPAGSNWDPPFDTGFNLGLVQGFSDYEYLYPFYYGRSGEYVLVLMFERVSQEGELRFAQSPNGGGTGNPAWDFVYFRRDYAANREFSFRARLVCQKFTSPEAVVRLYEQWSGERVDVPAQNVSNDDPAKRER